MAMGYFGATGNRSLGQRCPSPGLVSDSKIKIFSKGLSAAIFWGGLLASADSTDVLWIQLTFQL